MRLVPWLMQCHRPDDDPSSFQDGFIAWPAREHPLSIPHHRGSTAQATLPPSETPISWICGQRASGSLLGSKTWSNMIALRSKTFRVLKIHADTTINQDIKDDRRHDTSAYLMQRDAIYEQCQVDKLLRSRTAVVLTVR